MHTSKDDYLISTLRFFSAKESTQIYGAILPECLSSPAIKESKAYKTYLGYDIGFIPSKIARKFKKASPSKKDCDLVLIDKEPVTKANELRDIKEKVDVTRGKGIKLLSEVALNEEAQMKEVRKKGLRDFHKFHLSGSSIVAEKPPTVDKITPPVTSEGTGDKPGVLDVTKDESTESESKSWGNDEDNSNDENDLANEDNNDENKSDDDKTPSDSKKDSDSDQDTDRSESDSESDQQEYEEEVKGDDDDDKSEGDEDRRMDDTTNQFSDDVQDKKVDVEMTDAQQKKENLKITQEQVVEDAHVTITTVTKESKVPDASVSHSSDLASKFLNFLDMHPNDAEIVSPLDVHVHHEVPRIHTSTLLNVPVLVIPEASPLPQILSEEVSNFAPPVIEKMIEESLNQVNLAMPSSQPQSTYEAAATLTKFKLKKILIDKMNTSESYLTAPEHQECYDGPFARSDRGLKKRKISKDAEPTTSLKNKDSKSRSSKGTKSQLKSFGKSFHLEEPEFEVGDIDRPQGQEGNLGYDDVEPKKESASRRDWFSKPLRPQEPTDPKWNEDKTPKKGQTQNWLMTLAASTSTDKSLKEFDELMSTPIKFSSNILNGLKIENLTQEILLGLAFRLLKGTRSNYDELEYDFEECYKALSEKLD
nr:hypothetical protein [Tanacetum cinerariifolium]